MTTEHGIEPPFDSFVAERYDADNAPIQYQGDEAWAWCAGWNAAVESAIEHGLLRLPSDEQ